MFCTKCGAPIADGNKFCTKCGQPVPGGKQVPAAEPPAEEVLTAPAAPVEAPAPAEAPAPVEAPAPAETPAPAPVEASSTQVLHQTPAEAAPTQVLTSQAPAAVAAPVQAEKPKKKTGKIIALCVVALVVVAALAVGGFFAYRMIEKNNQAKENAKLLADAVASMEEGDYETAVTRYQKYIKRNSDDIGAKLGLAETYLHMGWEYEAIELLYSMEKDIDKEDGENEDVRRWNDLSCVASQDPHLWEVDTGEFPSVRMLIGCGVPDSLSEENFALTENGVQRKLSDFRVEDENHLSFRFETEDSDGSGEYRDFELTMTQAGFDFDLSGTYATPYFERVDIRIVDSDVTGYPTVALKIKLTDRDGYNVGGLSRDSFAVTEGAERASQLDPREITGVSYDWYDDVYTLEYRSDSAMDAGAARHIHIDVKTGGYQGALEDVFTPHQSTYEFYMMDISWEDADAYCRALGGHLATITSAEEEAKIIGLAEAAGARFVWLGGRTENYGYSVEPYWTTGEDFTYSNWYQGEPSGYDSSDGAAESYIMLWNLWGVWSWNDQRNDPAAIAVSFQGSTGFVCEFD